MADDSKSTGPGRTDRRFDVNDPKEGRTFTVVLEERQPAADSTSKGSASNGTDGESHHDEREDETRSPGRDANGNLLPGADGRVEVGGPGFRDINDRNGDGILDGQKNPVDVRGDRPGFEPPVIRPGLQDPGDLHLPGRGPRFDPDENGTPNNPGHGPTIVVDPVFPVSSQPPAGHYDDRGNNGGVIADPPPPAANLPPNHYGAPPAETSEEPLAEPAAPSSAIDTFETGTTPAVPQESPVAPVSAGEQPARAPLVAPVAFASAQPAAEPERLSPPEDATPGYIGGLDVVGAAAGLAPFGPGTSATDVFDAETIRAAASTAVADTTEEGGSNLLERIFDRVKDLVFESGPSPSSPVQLPQPLATTLEEHESVPGLEGRSAVSSVEFDDHEPEDGDLDDDV